VSALTEAVAAIREVLKLTDDLKRAGETLKEISKELREDDRRITRLEAQWDTALNLSGGRRTPPQLEDDP
jgi:cell shape-determining protein MreC